MVQHNTHFSQYRVSEIMRTARKRANLSQATVAAKLAITQGALSKMEHGQITPSAPQWFEFCRLAGISPDSLLLGYLESNRPIQLEEGLLETGYRMEDRFLKQRGLKVRALLPWANALKEKLGPDAFFQACKARGIDGDIFLDHDFQVNILVHLELIQMAKENGLEIGHLPALFPTSADRALATTGNSIQDFINFERTNTLDFAFKVGTSSPSSSEITIEPAEHLKKLRNWKPEKVGNGICQQFKQTLREAFLQNGEEVVAIHDEECLFEGNGKCCSYRIEKRPARSA
jgi:transcriptional regulator with XRE-family HTH domain